MDIRYQVFISSTFMDLEKERDIAVQTLMKMNCIPSGMELFPAADMEQFKFIKTIIQDCDYYLLIIGGRYGSLTEEGISYTEKEYDYAISKGIKVIAFLHKNPEELSVKNSEVTEEALSKLEAFRKKVSKGRLVEFWENKDQLAGMIALGLLNMIRMYPAIGWVRADKTSSVESLEEINTLRKKNHDLENKLKKYSLQPSSNSNKLASLDSKISITIATYDGKEIVGIFQITWLQIIRTISEIVFDSMSEWSIRLAIQELCLKGTDKGTTPRHIKVSDQDFNIIKIQFFALGFIEFSERMDPDDGEYYQVWESTAKGKQKILNLIAITDESN